MQEKQIERIHCSYPPYPIETLHGLGIAFNKEYQRSPEVWPLRKRQLLIDSILRGYDIAKIVLRQDRLGKFECLDGQQRLTTIFSYLKDGFSLSEKYTSEVGSKKFSELPENLKARIMNTNVYATLVHDCPEKITTQIFLRLQEGVPLNSEEKLNAMLGEVRDKVVELSKHNFFEDSGVSERRFNRRSLAAQILLLETGGAIDTKFKNLKGMYRRSLSSVKADEVQKVLSFLKKEFGDEAHVIKNNADFVSLYMLASHLRKTYSLTDSQGVVQRFLKDFLIRVGQIKSAEVGADHNLLNYLTYRSRSVGSKRSIEERFKILLSAFLKFKPDLELKDKQREFDYFQKLAIYDRDAGLCQGQCQPQKKLMFDDEDAEYHHKKRWADGGPTTVENGLLLCKECHDKIHGSDKRE